MKDSPMAGKHKLITDDAFYRDLGRTIRLTRVAAGKSQTDAADHLDCNFQQIQKYEFGANCIPVDSLVSLAAYLDVPMAPFTGTSSRSKQESAFLALLEKFEGKEFATLGGARRAAASPQAAWDRQSGFVVCRLPVGSLTGSKHSNPPVQAL